jgi:GTP-binding protein
MFVDKATIHVKAGDGGKGCCSFRREKFVPRGGPDGGDGGDGGNIIIRTAPGEHSLVQYRYNQHFACKHGTHGKGKNLHGKKSPDKILRVPVGTIVKNLDGNILADLDEADIEFVVAKGGKGGKGNTRFASGSNRVPMEYENGLPGEELDIVLELKTIADAGLVGFPNAGKSTLLSTVSDAHPKVAPYPFTTLHPVVGVVEYEDFRRLTIADIPGLIDGAHDNIGLGHSFLKHIERTKVLVFVLDMAGTDGRNPWDDYASLKEELELYMKGLSKRPSIIVANKMDEDIAQENLELLKMEYPNEMVIPVSAVLGENIQEFLKVLREMLIGKVR